MTIKVPYRGIIEIVGDHDTGKTIAALQVSNKMEDVVFVDDDVKGEGTVRQMESAGMKFDMYIDLAQERAKLGRAPSADELLMQVVLPTVEKITAKHHKVIIWDTWRIVYSSCRGHVERNQNKYSSVVTWRGSSTIIQGLISKVARMLEVKILNELKVSCDLLIITHHIKDNYIQNVVVGKIPESSATFSEVCNMRLWLRRNQQSKVPVILFLKRPSLPKLVSGNLRFVNVVPLKVTPTDKHQSIWDAIAEYEEKPIESRQPRADETPTSEELAAISGTLSPEQSQYVKMMIEYQKTLENDLLASSEETTTQAQEPSPEGSGRTETGETTDYPINGVALLSKAKAELGYSPEQVQEILSIKTAQIISTYNHQMWDTLLKASDKEISQAVSNEKPKKSAKK